MVNQDNPMALYDIRQNQRITKSEKGTKEVARGVEETQELILELKGSLQKLTVFCNAIWELLEETTDLSVQDLRLKLQQLEEKAMAECSDCGRPRASRTAANCLYCGTVFAKEKSLADLLQI